MVAVVDTGCDLTHPDLKANIWVNPREIPNNNIDDDGNGAHLVARGQGWGLGVGHGCVSATRAEPDFCQPYTRAPAAAAAIVLWSLPLIGRMLRVLLDRLAGWLHLPTYRCLCRPRSPSLYPYAP